MNQNDTLDFSAVEAAESNTGNYLKPGIYRAKPTEVELVERDGGTSAIKVTFEGVTEPYEGAVVEEKFFLSQKALPRLQYLHEKYLGFKLENKAITYQKLTDYLAQKLLTKPKSILLSVGGREGKDGKVYGQLPFTDFILDADANVEEGAYEEGSAQYNKSIKKNNNPSTMSNSGVLSAVTADSKSDLPWND